MVGIGHVPGCLFDACVCKHLVLGSRVGGPALARLRIHGAQLPAFRRIGESPLKSPPFLIVANREPVLDQNDSGPNQHALELGTTA